jgi:hypothetical protein
VGGLSTDCLPRSWRVASRRVTGATGPLVGRSDPSRSSLHIARGPVARAVCHDTTLTRTLTVADGALAPGHLGELTRYLPFELS